MTLGIYIQVPFCQTKCTYCNFRTGVVSPDRFEPYSEAVCREIAETVAANAPVVDSMYFGGGTPSLLNPAALRKIIDSIRVSYQVDSAEITLEADPETITPEKACAWHAAGFNRISLGAQSFSDTELQAAGRMHRRADILRAAEILRTAGFDNISMDLIAGLAHQSRASWEDSVTALLGIRPLHISIYMLEIDEGSRLGKESLAGGSRYSAAKIPPDDTIAEFYESACARLAAAGYEHYEISNWALPGSRSRHNLKYWRREPYLGFGAGASSACGNSRELISRASSRPTEKSSMNASPISAAESPDCGCRASLSSTARASDSRPIASQYQTKSSSNYLAKPPALYYFQPSRFGKI